jgi:outer membrane protein assembly factor BamB
MRAPHGEQNTNMKGIASKHAAKTHSKSPEVTPGGGPPQVIRQSTGQFPDVFRQFHVFLERFGHAISSPALANGIVFAGSDAGRFYALDASTGAKLWSYNIGDQ